MAYLSLVLVLSAFCISNANKETFDDVGLVQKDVRIHAEADPSGRFGTDPKMDEYRMKMQLKGKVQALGTVVHQLHETVVKTEELKAPAPVAPECKCISWQDAYKKHGAKCGQGHETDLVGGLMGAPRVQHEFCDLYFQKLPNMTMCMKQKFDSEATNWCYVSSECEQGSSLSSSPQIPQVPSLKTKTCTEGADKKLGDMNFEDFRKWCNDNKLEKGLVMQMAYPTFPDGHVMQILEFWGIKPPEGVSSPPMSDELRAKVEALVKSGKTTFINSPTGHPPYAVVEGQKFYWVNFSDKHREHERKGEDVWAEPHKMNLAKCVKGCGPMHTSEEWW